MLNSFLTVLDTSALSVFWFVLTIVVLFYFKKASRRYPQLQSNPILYRLLQLMILYIGILGGLFRLETLSQFYRSGAMSIVVLLWSIGTFQQMYLALPTPSPKRSVSIGGICLIALYGLLLAWNLAPHPWSFPSWFHSLPKYSQSLITIPIGLLAALFVHNIGSNLLLQLTIKNKSILDEELVSLFRFPLSISVFVLGLSHAVVHSDLSGFWIEGYHHVSLSVLITLWSVAFFKSVQIILKHLQSSAKMTIINSRTMPIFQLISQILVLSLSLYLLLLAWGIDVMLWITSASIIGVAIAYASQDTLASLMAGVAILSDAPYQLNDYLLLPDGTKGRVTHIGFRSTRLVTVDNIEIIIPNSIIANAQVINMSGNNTSCMRIEIMASVAYGSDIDQVRALLYTVIEQLDFVIHNNPMYQPVVHFQSMGASSLDFALRLWIDAPENMLKIQDQANTLIYKIFAEHKIEIPYSKQDVYLYDMSKKTKAT